MELLKNLLIVVVSVISLAVSAIAGAGSEALLIIVSDTSPSVSQYWDDQQRAAKALIAGAPPQVSIGVVGIDAEARKSELFAPSERARAAEFIDQLRIGGRFTDLARGTDAALALLQQADPVRGMIVYLTDAVLTVPKTFRDRRDFFDLLRREFQPRENIEVVVVSVRGGPLPQTENLPRNVSIVSLQSADQLKNLVAQNLSLAIREKLKQAAALPAPDAAAIEATGSWITYAASGLALLLALSAGAWSWRRRRAAQIDGDDAAAGFLAEAPPDVMREEDLNAPETVPAPPIAVIFAEDAGGRRGVVRQKVLRAGEQAVVGAAGFVEIPLAGLKQGRTLALRFDGQVVKAFRLRPSSRQEMDDVRFNQQTAPVEFVLGEKDALKVGAFNLSLVVTEEGAAPSSWARAEKPQRAPTLQLSSAGRRPALHVRREIYDHSSDKS
jgi:hypothetical protein